MVKLTQISLYYSSSLNFFSQDLGSSIELKFHDHVKAEGGYTNKLTNVYADFTDYLINRFDHKQEKEQVNAKSYNINHRQKWLSLAHKHKFDEYEPVQWPSNVRHLVGRFLLENVVFKACHINRKELLSQCGKSLGSNKDFEYAFHPIYRVSGFYSDIQIKVHPLLHRLFEDSLVFDATSMPMRAPPKPWHSHDQGGYFLTKKKLVRLHESVDLQNKTRESGEQYDIEALQFQEENERTAMEPVFDSLNVLSLAHKQKSS